MCNNDDDDDGDGDMMMLVLMTMVLITMMMTMAVVTVHLSPFLLKRAFCAMHSLNIEESESNQSSLFQADDE